EGALLDGEAGGGEFVEGGVELGEVARCGGFELELTLDQLEVRSADREGAGGEGGVGDGVAREGGEDDGGLAHDGLDRVVTGGGFFGRARGGERVHDQLLQGVFKNGYRGVGVHQLVERVDEGIERRSGERAQGGEGELEERELLLGADGAE